MSRNDRSLALLVIAVWTAALVLGALYLGGVRLRAQSNASPAGEQPDGSATAASSVASTTLDASPGTTLPGEVPPLLVAAGGDVIGDRKVGAFVESYGGEAVFAGVREHMRDAAVAFVNLESPLSDKGTPDPGKDVTFRGRPGLVAGLQSAGIDAVSLANNHALDYGAAALGDTIERLTAAGVAGAGAGADLAAARRPAVVDTPSGTVAILAFSNILPAGFPAGEARSGVNPARPDRDRLLADIASAADQHDWVLVSVHWGVEYQAEANSDQRDLARAAVDAGADLVLGHHPHVIQGLELYKDRLIAYSLGDFVFDHYSRETGEAFVLRVRLTADGPPEVRVVPVYLDDSHGIPAVVSGEAADRILDRLQSLSGALGLELQREGDLLVTGASG